jgi:chromosome segregation protein
MGVVRLASLTLEGFKSFAPRTHLSFPGAITAIIGPNGVGKSNICDAIAWVLGEQSARLLRSQTMADVIFNGAPQRPPAGSAQVTLELASGDGRWAEGAGTLELSRRVLRDGTSDYRIGGRRARLKDVVDNLMDAGLGTRSYAIIEQGRIGQVLSARATERRALFEEAAGISKFRVRRHEAELKLAETRANLLRVADVTSEVKRALDAARRQARQAERHRELRERLAALRAQLFATRRRGLATAVVERREQLALAATAEAEAAALTGHADAALEQLRQELERVQQRLAEARAEEGRADALAQRREAEETAARREHEDAVARAGQAGGEAQRLASAASDLALAEQDLLAALERAAAALAEEEQRAAAQVEVARGADEAAREAYGRTEEARRALLAAVAAANEAGNRAHRIDVEGEQVRYQLTRLLAERDRLSAHLTQSAVREEEAAGAEVSAGARAAQAEEARLALRRQLDAATLAGNELAAERDRVGHALWQTRHERDGVVRLIASARALPHGLAAALPAEKIRGTVADFLEPEADAAALLDRAYGDALTTPVLAGEDALDELTGRLDRLGGRLEVVVADDAGTTARPSPLLERAGAAGTAWLTGALPRAVVAASAEEARELARRDPDLVVLLPGGGRRRGQRVELPGPGAVVPGILELRRREQELVAREGELAGREAAVAGALEESRTLAAALTLQLADSDALAQTTAGELAAASSTRESLHRERARLEKELEAVGAELTRLDGESATLAAALVQAREEAERLHTRAGELEGELDRLARVAATAQRSAADTRAEAERVQGLAALARERRAGAERDFERQRAEVAALGEREASARAEEHAQRERAVAAANTAASARADLEELLARRAAAAREAAALADAESGLRERVTAAAREAEERRAAHMAARDATHAAELAITEANGALERLDESIALLLGGQAALPEEPPPAEMLPALEADEQQAAAQLEALGPVNELAVAERDELEQRFEFLKVQRRDLERSLESLAQTIHELDVNCAERFLTVLAEASVAFDQVFRILFGGGEARVELSDPDSPLDSGVDIRVRPPGKHIQSVLLLSGGEKALSAVALLLALFRIRPAPFCVLDEVDAPLDDANIERLCRLLREMSGETQFLLVTHNRRTMAHADVLYGVTMEEPGVSRIVSVRLEE